MGATPYEAARACSPHSRTAKGAGKYFCQLLEMPERVQDSYRKQQQQKNLSSYAYFAVPEVPNPSISK